MLKGRVVYQYAFDVASEIRTAEIRMVLSEKPAPFEIRVGQTVPRDIPIYKPLAIALRPEEVSTGVGRVLLKPFVKVFEIGVISITFEVGFQVATLGELLPYHQLAVGGTPLHAKAEQLAGQVEESLRPYLVKPSKDRPPAEAYTVFCLEAVDGPPEQPAADWVASRRAEIAALLAELAGPARLSTGQVAEALRHGLSYTDADYALVDWDSALVVDRGGYFDDVLYVLELANLQLEEFRILDDRLDRYFQRAYDDVERYYARRRVLGSPEKILRSLRSIRIDVAKMSEEVTNITKFVGDWYLARVYLACHERFHLGRWEASVDSKLKQLDEIYQFVQAEINNRRMLLLEALIVAMFVIDLAALFLLRK